MKHQPNNTDDDPISEAERAAVQQAAEALRDGNIPHQEGDDGGGTITDRAKGIRLIDPTDRFVFTHSPNGDISMMDTKPQGRGQGGSISGGDDENLKDESSEANHPFAIQIEITSSSPTSKSWTADVTVLTGKYQTDGDTQYTAAQVTQSFTTASGTIKPYIYLFIPLTPKTGGGWTAINGGQILFGANRPVAVWPQVYRTSAGYATSFQIGAWTVQVANLSAGIPTYGYRAVINQIIAEDVILEKIEQSGPRVFTQSLSVAGVVPTASEITTALQSAFPSGSSPSAGDIVNLTVGGVCKLRSTIARQGTTSGIYVVSFTVGAQTFYGHQVQTGLW